VCYAPVGEIIVAGALVVCHLCGRSLRSVTAHLRVHGWTKQAYCEAFGLERGQSLEGPETRKLRAAALASRLVFDPAVRRGSAAGRQRARTGDLTRDAARAARGRAMPEQRRRKAVAALAAIPPPVVAQANRDRAGRHGLARMAHAAKRHPASERAAQVAAGLGFDTMAGYVADRRGAGWTWQAMAEECGQPPSWLRRQVRGIA
jgi:hypothetical protein